jgi:hypothetical protein
MIHHHGQAKHVDTCNDPTLACASTATPAFGADGSLWLAFTAGERVYLARSQDLGRTFAKPTLVTPEPQQLDWGPDARPKIAIDKQGRITIAYAVFKDRAFNGAVFTSASVDGGRSFSPARPITDSAESQRFEALALDPDGHLFAAWLDKRNRVPAKARGEKYNGAALAFRWLSQDVRPAGETRLALDNTCECCRIGVAFAGPGRPVVLFRNIFQGGVRDHAVITFANPDNPGPVMRVSEDDWQTDACPHHGPSLSVAPGGSYHAVWYTNGKARQGLFYARSSDGGRTFSVPMAVGSADRQASRPSVLALSLTVHVAWKEFNGESTQLLVMTSQDGGRTWTPPREIARTDRDSDHPLLVSKGSQAFISWLTRAEGYRLIPLEGSL